MSDLLPCRTDALPEGRDYRDGGCSVAPSCLSCPLPTCRYDPQVTAKEEATAAQHRAIRAARAEGLTGFAIGRRCHVPINKVYEVLRAGGRVERNN